MSNEIGTGITSEKRKETSAMSTAVLLQEKQRKYLEEMDSFIAQLQQDASQEAKKEAVLALKRTGVINKNGKQKKKIVSWE